MTAAAATTMVRRTPVWRRLAGAGVTVLAMVAIATWAMTLRPLGFGGPAEYVVIHGNSMFPTYHEGDLIITHAHTTYAVGDVIAYRVPQGQLGQGLVVIHRIVGGSDSTGLVLRGDNNPVADPWHPRATDVVGSTWTRIPRLGKLFVAIHKPLVPGLFLGAVAAVFVLRRQTRSHQSDAQCLAGKVIATPQC